MHLRRFTTVLTTAALATALTAPMASAGGSSTSSFGSQSLAEVLTSDGNQFDEDANDYDLLTEAVLAVLAAKPDSPVGVLADGSVRVTAFLPDDAAFRDLARSLTGTTIASESELFAALVATAGVDTIEAILLYHVVPGVTLKSWDALKADGAKLDTALEGATVRVDVLSKGSRVIELVDQDRNARNAIIDPQAYNINRGNRQIAHGITSVMRPLDL